MVHVGGIQLVGELGDGPALHKHVIQHFEFFVAHHGNQAQGGGRQHGGGKRGAVLLGALASEHAHADGNAHGFVVHFGKGTKAFEDGFKVFHLGVGGKQDGGILAAFMLIGLGRG